MIPISNLVRNMQRFRILIADPDPAIRRDLRAALKNLGFMDFREAENGAQTWKVLKTESVDFMFYDWDQPNLNGISMLVKARNEPGLKGLAILLMVSNRQAQKMDGILGEDEDGFLTKPITSESLQEKLGEILFRRLPPSPIDPHLAEAGRLMAEGKLTWAQEALDRAALVAPRDPIVNYFRRLIFEAEGRPEKAQAAVEKARRLFRLVVLGPKKARQKITQGKNLLAAQRIEEAKKCFSQALDLDPDNPERMVAIGEAFLASGMLKEAEINFSAYLEAAPDNVYFYNRLGMIYRRQKKYDHAIKYYQKALALDHYEENIFFNLARVYLKTRQYEHARDALQKALALQPGFKEAQDLLAYLPNS